MFVSLELVHVNQELNKLSKSRANGRRGATKECNYCHFLPQHNILALQLQLKVHASGKLFAGRFTINLSQQRWRVNRGCFLHTQGRPTSNVKSIFFTMSTTAQQIGSPFTSNVYNFTRHLMNACENEPLVISRVHRVPSQNIWRLGVLGAIAGIVVLVYAIIFVLFLCRIRRDPLRQRYVSKILYINIIC